MVTSKQIFDTFKSTFGANIVKEIKNLSQYGSSRTWIVGFNAAYDIKNLIGKEISFHNIYSIIYDANKFIDEKVTLTAILRVLWLPNNMDILPVKEFINSLDIGTIIECEKEKYRDEEMSHIENGVFKIKIKYDIEHHERLLVYIGKSKIDNQVCLLQLVGHPPKCLYCKNFGHMSSSCPNKSNINNKSSYASIIVNSDINYQDLERNEQIVINIETKSTSNESEVVINHSLNTIDGAEHSKMLKLGDASRYGHKRGPEELDESNNSVLDQKKSSKFEYDFELSGSDSPSSNNGVDSDENSRMDSDSISEIAKQFDEEFSKKNNLTQD